MPLSDEYDCPLCLQSFPVTAAFSHLESAEHLAITAQTLADTRHRLFRIESLLKQLVDKGQQVKYEDALPVRYQCKTCGHIGLTLVDMQLHENATQHLDVLMLLPRPC
jgi:hypothetical protein